LGALLVAAALGLAEGLLLNVAADRWAEPEHPDSRHRSIRWIGLLAVACLLAVVTWLWSGGSSGFARLSAFSCLLILIAVVDLEHRLVPNVLVMVGGLLVLADLAWLDRAVLDVAWGTLVGGGTFFVLAGLRPGALGMGDIKLAALIGMMTGYPEVLLALASGIVLGGIAAAVALITRLRTAKQYIPYAPYLVAGALLALLQGSQVLDWYAGVSGLGG
jgi:leader peptidase (prepilin peptidase)/N-methyltransferase